eukprot:COSAG01_NODE_2340_length_7871_cov_32.734431_2_plen_75_part_00
MKAYPGATFLIDGFPREVCQGNLFMRMCGHTRSSNSVLLPIAAVSAGSVPSAFLSPRGLLSMCSHHRFVCFIQT